MERESIAASWRKFRLMVEMGEMVSSNTMKMFGISMPPDVFFSPYSINNK